MFGDSVAKSPFSAGKEPVLFRFGGFDGNSVCPWSKVLLTGWKVSPFSLGQIHSSFAPCSKNSFWKTHSASDPCKPCFLSSLDNCSLSQMEKLRQGTSSNASPFAVWSQFYPESKGRDRNWAAAVTPEPVILAAEHQRPEQPLLMTPVGQGTG